MFIIRRLIFIAAVPVLLFFGASAVVEAFAESQLADGMRRTLSLNERPDVQIEAFPFLLRVVQGRIPRVRVDASTIVIEELEIRQLSLDLEGVEASLGALVRWNRFDLTVDHGDGSVRVAERSINAYLARKKEDVLVTLREDGTVAVTAEEVIGGRRRRFVATGHLTLGGRTLSFRPDAVTMDGRPVPAALRGRARRETSVSVDLPMLPAGIVPGEVLVTKGELSLVANLEGFVLEMR